MLFIITFFLIFGWKVALNLDISAITALILSFQYIVLHRNYTILKKNIPAISLFILVLYSSFIVLINGITDLSPILRSLRAFVMLIACFSLYELYRKHYKKPTNRILFHIYLSLLIHGLIMIVMFWNTDFRLFVYNITDAKSIVNLKIAFLEGLRICGLTYGMSQTSVLQIMGIFLIPSIFKTTENNFKKFFIILSFPILILSSLLAGRSGVFLFVIFLPLYLLLKVFFLKDTFKNSLFNKQLGKAHIRDKVLNSCKLLILALLSFSILFWLSYNYLPERFNNYNLATIKEFMEAIKFEGPTMELLKGMYFLPDNPIITIFGKGNYGRTQIFYLKSDVGWIKSFFAIGLIGNILMIFPFLWGISTSFKRNKELGELAIAAIFVFLLSILLNCKELALLTRNQWTIQAVLLAILRGEDAPQV